jgi:trigger factor
MKTKLKDLGKCKVELKVEIDADEAKSIVKDVEKVFLREAKLPGFRPGKAPIELIRKEFSESLSQEMQRAMFQKNYALAVEEEKIEEVALVNVKDISCSAEGGAFTAEIDVKPKFKLPTYKGLKVSSKDVAVKDSEVEETLNRMRKAYAKTVDATADDVAAEGDFVQIDYSGTVKGKSILEINAEAKFVAEGKGYWTQIEEGRFLPEILDALKGMKIGETKEDVKAKFDKESAPEGLKGEKALYKITLVALRKRILATDEELVEKTKSESFEKYVASIRENMEKFAVEQEARRREDEAIELLLKKADFDVPQTLVDREKNNTLMEFAKQAQYSGLDAKYFQDNRDKIMNEAEESAVKRIRLWYILQAIALEEKIEGSEEELGKKVVDFVLANAKG